jgi:hypothetical protein
VLEVYKNVILGEFEMHREQFGLEEDAVISFLDYVERTWVGRRMGRSSYKSLFPIPSWNHHTSILTGRSFYKNSHICQFMNALIPCAPLLMH